jgi:hypothetical protein
MKQNEFKKIKKVVPKYGAIPTTVNGKKFASKKEARRYKQLKLMSQAGLVNGLRCQVSFSLNVGDTHICRYVADFVYFENGVEIVEDVKGFLTPVYKIKRKLMKAIYGVEIRET